MKPRTAELKGGMEHNGFCPAGVLIEVEFPQREIDPDASQVKWQKRMDRHYQAWLRMEGRGTDYWLDLYDRQQWPRDLDGLFWWCQLSPATRFAVYLTGHNRRF